MLLCWLLDRKSLFNRIWRINAKSHPFAHAFLGVRFKVVQESACMACKRSAVRSRYSPPKKHCTSQEVQCFSFCWSIFWGAALLCLHAFLAFAENRDVPADKRVPITKETAVQQWSDPQKLDKNKNQATWTVWILYCTGLRPFSFNLIRRLL